MNPKVRVLEDYDSRTDRYIILDKNWYTTPTKLTDGFNTVEVMLVGPIGTKYFYNIRNMGLYKCKWSCGTVLTELGITTKELNKKYKDIPFKSNFSVDYVGEKSVYGEKHKSFIEQGEIPATIQNWIDDFLSDPPLYLEEELVPSQGFGLDDYLKIKK